MNEQELYKFLVNWRLTQSKKEKVPAYVIFHNFSLLEIAKKKPKNVEELQEIHGIGEYRIQKYAEAILHITGGIYSPPISINQDVLKKSQINVNQLKAENIVIIRKAREFELLKFLPERMRKIVDLRYPLEGKSKSLQEIGEEFGVSKQRISQVLETALVRLNKRIRKYDKNY